MITSPLALSPTFDQLLREPGRKDLSGIDVMVTFTKEQEDDLFHLVHALKVAELDLGVLSRSRAVLVRHDWLHGYIKDETTDVYGITPAMIAWKFINWNLYHEHVVENGDYIKVQVKAGRFTGTWYVRN